MHFFSKLVGKVRRLTNGWTSRQASTATTPESSQFPESLPPFDAMLTSNDLYNQHVYVYYRWRSWVAGQMCRPFAQAVLWQWAAEEARAQVDYGNRIFNPTEESTQHNGKTISVYGSNSRKSDALLGPETGGNDTDPW
jgi:hypothetical protein